MRLPVDVHIVALGAGVVLLVAAFADALLFHRQSGLSGFDYGLIGTAVTALGYGGGYYTGLRTPTP